MRTLFVSRAYFNTDHKKMNPNKTKFDDEICSHENEVLEIKKLG